MGAERKQKKSWFKKSKHTKRKNKNNRINDNESGITTEILITEELAEKSNNNKVYLEQYAKRKLFYRSREPTLHQIEELDEHNEPFRLNEQYNSLSQRVIKIKSKVLMSYPLKFPFSFHKRK